MTAGKTITIQPSEYVDAIAPGGTEMTRLPYPFHVTAEDGMVQRQDFWRGRVEQVIGFVAAPDSQKFVLTWSQAVKRPFEMIGKYVVTSDAEGNWSTHLSAISQVMINGLRQRWLVVGNGHWGQGLTLAEAKANYTRHGGQLSRGYEIVHFGQGSEFGGVDDMGRYHWTGDTPSLRVVAARKPHARA